MGLLLRGALRSLYKARGVTVAVVLLMMLGTGFLAGIGVAAENFERYQLNSMIDTMGHVSLFGAFDQRALTLVQGLDGVQEARLYYWATGEAALDGSRVPVVMVDSRILQLPLIEASTTPGPGEALAYVTLTGMGVEGVRVEPGPVGLVVYNWSSGTFENLTLTVVGEARGVSWLGSTDSIVLIVNRTLLERITGGHPAWLAIWAGEPSDEAIERLANESMRLLEESGYTIVGSWVNRVEQNPLVRVIEGMTRFIRPYILVAVALVAVVSMTSGMLVLVRSTREVGVLRALGAGKGEVALFYSLPWALRIVLGALMGALIAPLVGEGILRLTTGESGVLDILFEAYGFAVPLRLLAWYTVLSILLAMLGAIPPGLVAAGVRPVEALRFYGLRNARAIRPGLGGPLLRYTVRRLFSRLWRLVGVFLSFSLILGAAVGAAIVGYSVSVALEEYWDSMDYDIMLVVRPTSLLVAPDYSMVYRILDATDGVVAYQSVACSIGDYMPWTGLLVSIATVERGEQISFRVIEGREPGPGEAVISVSLSRLLGASIGDRITVRSAGGSNVSLRVVGIGVDKCNNYLVWTSPDDYEAITGERLDREARVIYVKAQGDPSTLAETLARGLNRNPTVLASYRLASDLRERAAGNLGTFKAITYGFTLVSLVVGMGVLVSIIQVDNAGNAREYGVLIALGVGRWRLALLEGAELALTLAASIPLAAIIGYAIALSGQQTLLTAGMGYVEIHATLGSILTPEAAVAAALSLAAGVLATRLYLGRLRLAETLRPE